MILAFIGKILLRVIIQVLLKIIYSVATEQVISSLIFKSLHALAKKTESTKDDEFVNRIEDLYNSMPGSTDNDVKATIDKIKLLKRTDDQE